MRTSNTAAGAAAVEGLDSLQQLGAATHLVLEPACLPTKPHYPRRPSGRSLKRLPTGWACAWGRPRPRPAAATASAPQTPLPGWTSSLPRERGRGATGPGTAAGCAAPAVNLWCQSLPALHGLPLPPLGCACGAHLSPALQPLRLLMPLLSSVQVSPPMLSAPLPRLPAAGPPSPQLQGLPRRLHDGPLLCLQPGLAARLPAATQARPACLVLPARRGLPAWFCLPGSACPAALSSIPHAASPPPPPACASVATPGPAHLSTAP